MIKLYNTLTRSKEEFVPITPGEVKMYSCGPTVYNYFHIGNARPFIIFDTLRRYLEYRGFRVTFVQNFTDIDDKMINKANELGITVKELADQYIAEYFIDAHGLGIRDATIQPRATENIDAIIQVIQTLEEKGFAYNVDGDVYFETAKDKNYGKLSKMPLEDLEAGARIHINETKKHAADFALWKKQKEGEPAWESPWGMGRPGWHIECSAMVNKFLGETIDIHSGGQDLIFPHHENEIAQSECCNGKPFAHYWMHNGYINVNNEKMSKSAGNFFTVRDVAAKFDYEVIRFFMLSAHYRNTVNFSDELLMQSKASLERLYTGLYNLEFLASKTRSKTETESEKAVVAELGSLKQRFTGAMDDDLNTADAVSVLFDAVRLFNTKLKEASERGEEWTKTSLENCINLLKELGGVLGILEKKQEDSISEEAKALIAQRTEAREAKDWARADELREQLRGMGVELEDTRQGVRVHIVKE